MTARLLLGVAAGTGCGAGLLLLVSGLRGSGRIPARRAVPWRQVATGTVAGLLALAVTRWLAVALALGVLTGCWTQLFGGTKRARTAIAQLEALAAWTESMRDLVATGLALPEALTATAGTASPLLAAPLTRLRERLQNRESLEAALRALADDLDDVSADLVVAALVLTSRAHGRRLNAVLSALAGSARAELVVRRGVEADRRATRRGVRIVLLVTIAMALGLRLLNPGYVQPYETAAGQLALAVIVAVFGIGFGWLHRLSRLPQPQRFLATAAPQRRPGGRPGLRAAESR